MKDLNINELPFLKIPKVFIEVWGLSHATFLANLLEKKKYLETKDIIKDEWFFAKMEDQVNCTGLKKDAIRKSKKLFQELEILKIKRKKGKHGKGPVREWYLIHTEVLKKQILEFETQKEQEKWVEISDPTRSKYPNTIIKNTVKEKDSTNPDFSLRLKSNSYESCNFTEIAQMALTSEERILKIWNKLFSSVLGVGCHKSLGSKTIQDDETKETLTVFQLISTALKLVSENELISAMQNYHTIITSSDYYYSHKMNLARWLYSGLRFKKGFLLCLTSANPLVVFSRTYRHSTDPWENLRREFIPITEEYDLTNVFDEETKKYYGFEENDYKAFTQWYEIADLALRGKLIHTFRDIWALECYLAGCFFYRKTKTKDKLHRVTKLMKVWRSLTHLVKTSGFLK